MYKAILRQTHGRDNWDNMVLVINGPGALVPWIRLKDRESVMDLYRQIFVAELKEHEGDLDVKIDGKSCTLSQDVWFAVGRAIDPWYEDYVESVLEADGKLDFTG